MIRRLPVQVENKINHRKEKQPNVGVSLGRGGEQGGARLSVVELRGICPLLLILLVILHAFESLAGEVFKHNVIITSGDTGRGV